MSCRRTPSGTPSNHSKAAWNFGGFAPGRRLGSRLHTDKRLWRTQARLAQSARHLDAEAAHPAPPKPGRQRELHSLVAPLFGQRRQTPQYGVDQRGSLILLGVFDEIDAFAHGRVVWHTVKKAHLVSAHFDGDANVRVHLFGTAAGYASHQRLQLSAPPQHAIDDFRRKARLAGIQSGEGAVERVARLSAMLNGQQNAVSNLTRAGHIPIIEVWNSKRSFCAKSARPSRGIG